jgi:hypothetical protein
MIPVGRVVIQVQVHKVDGYVRLQAGSDGLYEGIRGFYRKIDALVSAVLIQDYGYFRESPYAIFDHLPERVGQFHGHSVWSEMLK